MLVLNSLNLVSRTVYLTEPYKRYGKKLATPSRAVYGHLRQVGAVFRSLVNRMAPQASLKVN